MALIQANFTSSCLKRPVRFNAVVPVDSMFAPPGAAKEQKPLKTVYLLHGYSGSCSYWFTDSVLSSIAQRTGLAIIMANDENHFYVDDMRRLDMYGEHIGREWWNIPAPSSRFQTGGRILLSPESQWAATAPYATVLNTTIPSAISWA